MTQRFNTVIELIESAFESYAELPAYSCMGREMSYAELDQLSLRFASYLRNELKLNAGDRLAIQLPNILQFPVAMYGAIRAGLVIVNVNPLYTGRELKHQLQDSGAKALVVLANVAAAANAVVDQTPVEHVIVTELGDLHPGLKRPLINFVVKHVKKLVPDYNFKHGRSFLAALKHNRADFSLPSTSAEDLLVLQYTGGTTGLSKGAMLTHGNLCANVWQMVEHMPVAFGEGEDVFVGCLPLYHIYALNLHALAGFSRGCATLLIPNPRDLNAFAKALAKHKFTVFIGINTLFRALVRHKGFCQLDFSQLKITSAGGMALTEDAAVAWEQLTGCKIIEGYGLTETSPVLTGNPHDDIRLGSIGTALPETDIVILDDNEEPVTDGEVGELCAKGPQIMPGYWQKDDETAKVFSASGYFKTGDMAKKLDDGYFKIVDRKKDMILVSGFNVYPNEIEDVLCSHPDIKEAAAIGVADECSGEIVKVFIVRENDELSEKEVKKFAKANLTPYKVPKIIEFRQELPKTNVGKILRRELRDSAQ
ncbi:AMP-binding protein [Agaribacterium haliotis]|uniref:AMP-binding protein n=1 Tax=Agaribacterium haliotis TaxID=2013869 RepID=UPI000BB568EB|nr:AMP-binding protein [Agaribacterium haliotis]